MEKKRQSGRRAVDKPSDLRDTVEVDGPCTPISCVGDVACKPLPDGMHTCICTHDSQPPFADGTCPRNVIASGSSASEVDESSGRIPVQPIGSHENHYSLTKTSKPPPGLSDDHPIGLTEKHHSNAQTYILIPALVFFVIILGVAFYVRRRFRKERGASPLNLKHNFLTSGHYASNPQYSVCAAAGIPILREENLSFHEEVGEGCFGKVFKGELQCSDGDIRTVAIKVLKDNASREAEDDFLREVEIMSAFRHSNILSLLGVVSKDENVNPMMIFEFMSLGDLADLLRAQKQSILEMEVPQLTGKDLMTIAMQIAEGMKYLASQRFVHRDLACRNCLVSEGPLVKIADFGMSRDVYTCDYYKIGGSRLLPVRWMSPESVIYGRFTLESDIWSYGVVLWEIFSFGKQPYYGHSNEQVVKLITDGVKLIPPKECPSSICELMENCWKTEPRHRIPFPSICETLDKIFEMEKYTNFSYETERGKSKLGVSKSLPRPPPLPTPDQIDLLDAQGYLKPSELKEPVIYLETVCD